MVYTREKRQLATALKGVKPREGSNQSAYLTKYFGCVKCTWQGTTECPHGIRAGGHHANYICSARKLYLQERLKVCGTVPRLIQAETLFKLSEVTEPMLKDWANGEGLDPEFKYLAKLIVGLTDKMRRQDEGIKIAGEITVAHEDFKKLVETEAKKIEEQNNRTRPGEFTEEVQAGE